MSDVFHWEFPLKTAKDLDIQRVLAKWPELKPHLSMHKSDGVVGVEVEVENHLAHYTEYEDWMPYFWNTAKDGSLRNLGVEYISHPLRADQVELALNLLHARMEWQRKNAEAPMAFSDLCGIHVHLNVRDLTLEQIANLFLTYLPFEQNLFEFSGNRDSNIFCLPLTSLSPSIRQFLVDPLGRAASTALMAEVKSTQKYSAFNFKPLMKLGTIEFRHMEGNMNVPRILSWVGFILKMRDFAKQQKYTDLFSKIVALNTNSQHEAFCRDVFGELSSSLIGGGGWKGMADGVCKVKSLSVPAREIWVEDRKPKRIPKPIAKIPEERAFFMDQRLELRDAPPARRHAEVPPREAMRQMAEAARRQEEANRQLAELADRQIEVRWVQNFVVQGDANAVQDQPQRNRNEGEW